MTLTDYNFINGVLPNESVAASNFTMISNINGLSTYDKNLGTTRSLMYGEIPIDSNNYITIKRNLPTSNQVKIQLNTGINSNMVPPVNQTIIIDGKIDNLDVLGNCIASSQFVSLIYDWKLYLYPDKLVFKKQDKRDFDINTYNPTKDKYVSVDIPNNFVVGDTFTIILRFTRDFTTGTNNNIDIDVLVNTNILTPVSLSYNFNLATDGNINFFDFDYEDGNSNNLYFLQSGYLLRGCISINNLLTDGEVNEIFTDSTILDNIFESNTNTTTSNVIKRKTLSFISTDTSVEVFKDSDIPSNKRLYIHGCQIRLTGCASIDPLHGYILMNTSPFEFARIESGVIPTEGYWTLNNMVIAGGSGNAGFLESGGTLGYGVSLFPIQETMEYDGFITIYYTIED